MPLSDERVRALVLDQLTDGERGSSVMYLATDPVAAGTTLQFARLTFVCPWDAHLVFVDLDPMANWGHACRYVCVNRDTGETRTTAAQLPPFGPPVEGHPHYHWRVIHKSPGVPDAVLAVPRT